MTYGPFSPVQRLLRIHFPNRKKPLPGSPIYYDITYTLTVGSETFFGPANKAIAVLQSVLHPGNQTVQPFTYPDGGAITLQLSRVSGDCVLYLMDTAPRFADLIDITSDNFLLFWGSFVATATFGDGSSLQVRSPISPHIGQSGFQASGNVGINGDLFRLPEVINPAGFLGVEVPDGQIFGVIISNSIDFNPRKPSGTTSVNGWFILPPNGTLPPAHTVS